MLHIAGIGTGEEMGLTIEVNQLIRAGLPLIFKTRHCPLADELEKEGIAFESLDVLFENASDFDKLNESIAEHVISKASACGDLVYAVFGAGGLEDLSVAEIIKRGAQVKLHPGLPLHAAAYSAPVSPAAPGFYALSASDIASLPYGLSGPICVTELFSPLCASDVKLRFLEEYPEDAQIHYISVKNGYKYEKIAVLDIDRLNLKWYHHLACLLYIPGSERTLRTLEDLDSIMDIMRSPGGCPWVRAQTHESIRRDLLEECYEVLEAIDTKDMDKLADELGDLLLQVIFHSRLARERGEFSVRDVIERECRKQIARTPYVFGNESAGGVEEALNHWDAEKAKEKGFLSLADRLDDVPLSLPALMYAQKVLKRVQAAEVELPDFGDGTGSLLLRIVMDAQSRGEDAEEELRLAARKLVKALR